MEPQTEAERPFGKEAVCQALIEAATSLIARQGVAGVTTRAIADQARVNQGLITRYFGTKQGLVHEVANAVAGRLFNEVIDRSLSLNELLAGGGPGHRETFRALIHIILDADSPAGGLVDQALLGRFFQWLRQQAGGDAGEHLDARAFLVVSLILGTELVAPRLQADLGLDDAGFRNMRKAAAELFLAGF